jgi:hypothetical protein
MCDPSTPRLLVAVTVCPERGRPGPRGSGKASRSWRLRRRRVCISATASWSAAASFRLGARRLGALNRAETRSRATWLTGRSALPYSGSWAASFRFCARVGTMNRGKDSTPSPPRSGGEGWGEEVLWKQWTGPPLSPTLSPLLRHGARETRALEPNENIEHRTSHIERRSEWEPWLPFEVQSSRLDVRCFLRFMGRRMLAASGHTGDQRVQPAFSQPLAMPSSRN